MNGLVITPKGAKKVGRALLKDNWTRAVAVFTAAMFGAVIFLLVNNLITTLIDAVTAIDAATPAGDGSEITGMISDMNKGTFKLSYIVTLIMAAFYFMFISPLTLGSTRWYHSLAECGSLQVGQIFYYYRGNERFVEALVFELRRLERHIIVFAVSLAPAAACFGYLASISKDSSKQGMRVPLIVGGCALVVAGLIIYALWMLRYFLAKYLMVSGRGYEVADTFKISARYMQGLHGKVLKVYLSLIPYLLACLLIAPAVVAVPMIDATLASCAQDIIDAKTPV